MKVTLYGKEYELENIDCIRIGGKVIGIDKKCWLEVVENGVATKIEGTNTIGKTACVNALKKLMLELKDKGCFVIDSNKDFLINIENADKIELYENLSLLGKKYFLRVELNGKTFDTMYSYNKSRYNQIENNFREKKSKELREEIDALVGDKKYSTRKNLQSVYKENNERIL